MIIKLVLSQIASEFLDIESSEVSAGLLRSISNQENIFKRSRFSRHSNIAVIACNRENESHLSVYPLEASKFLVWCCKCKLHNGQLLSFEYQLLQLRSQSETLHNIFFTYKTAKIVDNKISIASEGL